MQHPSFRHARFHVVIHAPSSPVLPLGHRIPHKATAMHPLSPIPPPTHAGRKATNLVLHLRRDVLGRLGSQVLGRLVSHHLGRRLLRSSRASNGLAGHGVPVGHRVAGVAHERHGRSLRDSTRQTNEQNCGRHNNTSPSKSPRRKQGCEGQHNSCLVEMLQHSSAAARPPQMQ